MLAKIKTEGLLLTAVLLLGGSPIAVAVAGCDDNHYLGRTPEGSPDSGSAGGQGGGRATPGTGGQTPPPIDAGTDAREVGMLGPSSSWTGYIENQRFQSGSDVIKITFASDAAGLVVGKVTLGSGTPPPPATDAEATYPPGFDPQGARTYLAEGFPFSMNGGTLVGRRLRFTLAASELWSGWCALQTPVDSSGGCLPNWGGMVSAGMCAQTNPQTHQVVPVSCAKFFMCTPIRGVCACAAGACTADMSWEDVSFDMAIAGNEADGSVVGRLGDRNVHFTKDM